MGSTAFEPLVFRHVHNLKYNLEFKDGDCRIRFLEGADILSNHNHPAVQCVLEQAGYERPHENNLLYSKEGRRAMLHGALLHPDSVALLFLGGQYADCEQVDRQCPVESEASPMGAKFFQ
ncbi:hypothetical protein SLA2020_259010 [Shorea laevis]